MLQCIKCGSNSQNQTGTWTTNGLDNLKRIIVIVIVVTVIVIVMLIVLVIVIAIVIVIVIVVVIVKSNSNRTVAASGQGTPHPMLARPPRSLAPRDEKPQSVKHNLGGSHQALLTWQFHSETETPSSILNTPNMTSNEPIKWLFSGTGGPQYRLQYTVVLIMGTPKKKVPLISAPHPLPSNWASSGFKTSQLKPGDARCGFISDLTLTATGNWRYRGTKGSGYTN